MEKGPIYRIGTFLIILGGLMVIIFFGSLASRDSATGYLLIGLVSIFLGFSLHRRKTEQTEKTEQPEHTSRFHTARKYRDRYQKKSDDKQNKDTQT